MKHALTCIFCSILAFSIVSGTTVNAINLPTETTIIKSDELLQPRRFIAIFTNAPSLSINNTTAEVKSSVEITGNYSYEVITTLQRSTNKSSWTNVVQWTETGFGSLSKRFSYSYAAAINLYYQVSCTINIYSNGILIESNTETSPIIRCT